VYTGDINVGYIKPDPKKDYALVLVLPAVNSYRTGIGRLV
jgi:hypothetical protein